MAPGGNCIEKLTQSFCKLDHFRATDKMFPIMKWVILQRESANIIQNFFIILASGVDLMTIYVSEFTLYWLFHSRQ
jgi:hypothetical protein